MTRAIDDTDDSASELPPFVPDHEWLDALQIQLTEPMLERVRSFARVRALGVARAGRKVDDYYARELVQDAVADTYTGVLRWDPSSATLEAHLVRAVQFRTRDDRARSIARPHESLDDSSDGARAAEQELTWTYGDGGTERRHYAAEMIAQVRAEAAGDRDVIRILEAYEASAITKADVMTHARMKARTYQNAHNRLVRIVRNLSSHKLAAERVA